MKPNTPSQLLGRALVAATVCLLAAASSAHAQPTFSKSFSPSSIGPGSASTLTFTIDNTSSGFPVTNLAFTDILPAGVTLASPAAPQTTCANTDLSAPDGGGTITLSDGELPAGSTCTVSVLVTSSTVGTHMNVSGDLTSGAGNSGPATADLTVATDRPGFTKNFSPSTVPLGSRSTLTFTIDNTANAASLTSGSFTDTFPAGLEIADPSNVSTDCGTAPVVTTLTADAGTSVVGFSFFGNAVFPLVGAGASCTITLDVVPTGQGALDNVSSVLNVTRNFPPGGNVDAGHAVATLTATTTELVLIKEFLADPVAPGDTVDLEFTILNRSRDTDASDITFTDNLGDAGGTLSGLAAVAPLPTNPCGAGSSLSGTTTLSLANGAVPAQGSCSFTVTLQVPPGATPGIYSNTTSAVAGTVGGAVVGNMASDDLFVFAAPLLTKTFLDDPAAAGDTTTVRFTITNTSATSSATDIAFQDDFDIIFPTASAVPPTACCGAGSTCTVTPLVNPPPPASSTPARLTVTGGSLAPSDVCMIDVTLDISPAAAAGIYVNTTTDVTATVDGDVVTGNAATDDIEIVGGPILNKEFTDDPASPGDLVTLQFTLQYDESAASDATAISFTDDLDATLTGLAPLGLPLMNVCGAGSQIADNLGTLEFTGGTLSPGATCQFSVTLQVPMVATAGIYPNTTSAVDATVSGLTVTTPAATDDLVVAGLTLAKQFTNDPVIPGGTVNLQFTLVNQAGAPSASSIAFSDDLGALATGLTFDPGSVPATPCGAGSTITLLSGNRTMGLTNGSLGAGEMCQFSLTVNVPVGVSSGTYPNLTQNFRATIDGNLLFLDNAADDLIVAGDLLQLTKTFLTNPVAPGALVDLEFELTNLSASGTATDIAFTDDLDAALTGLVATNLPVAGCGSTATANPGPGTIDFSGGSLGPGASCTFTVTVQVPAMPAAPSAVNTTSSVSGTIGGLGVTGDPATDTLTIQNVDFIKSFDGPTVTGGTAVLTFTIDNLTATPVSSLSFSDDLNAVLSGLAATGLPLTTPCGAGSSLAGTSFLTFTGGDLDGNASCSFNVTVQLPAASPGTYPNTSSALLSSGLEVADPATADLVVEPPPTFAKVFAPDVIGSTGVSTLTFTIDNTASALEADSLSFTDNLPANVEVASPANASTTCTGGTITATAGTGTIVYSGGSVAAGENCTLDVDVTSAVAGTHVNTSGDLTSSSGNSGTAEDALEVEPPPLFSKAFAPTDVPIGAPSTLTFTIDNTASSLAATALDFTDNLPADVLVATVANASTTCTGGTLTAVASSAAITYTGGTVAAGATCTVQVDVTPSAAGSHLNQSGDLTSSNGNSGPASDTLSAPPVPTFSKIFAPDLMASAAVSTLTFTLDNSGSTVLDATGLDFTDNLPPGLTVASPANASTTCTGGTLTATAGTGVVTYTGGSVAAGAICTVQVDVTATTPGDYVNTSGDLTSSLGNSGPATDTLTVAQPPAFTKAFAPNPIALDGLGNLTFTIDNSAAGLAASGLDFTDNLPAGVEVAATPNAATTCGGTVTAVGGTGTIGFTGGSVAAGATCTVRVDVTGTVAGSHVNVSGDLTSSLGNSGTASDTLDVVVADLGLSKTILSSPVLPGGLVDVEYTVSNASAVLAVTGLTFTDDFDAALGGLTAVTLPGADPCGAGSTVTGTSVLTLAGGSLPVSGSCTFTVTLQVPADAATGTYPGATSGVSGMAGGGSVMGPAATDTLVVAYLEFTKAFASSVVSAGNVVDLIFTLINPDPVNDATDLAFTDDLDAMFPGTVAEGLPLDDVCGAGSQVSGTSVIQLTGGFVPAGGDCSFAVPVRIPPGGSGLRENVTSSLAGAVNGLPVVAAPTGAQDVLEIVAAAIAIPVDAPWALLLLAAFLAVAATRQIRLG